MIAMSCYTSYGYDLSDVLYEICREDYSFSWAYGIGWTSVVIALFGSIISTIVLFMSQRDAANPNMSLEH